MIVTRTPLRLTLGGGGTDLASYYRDHGGSVFAMGIDRYVYVMVNRPVLETEVRVSHRQTEVVSRVSELEHELAREALRHQGIEDRIEVASMADLPGGTGLGSSGAYLVGLLAALHRQEGRGATRRALAEAACDLEMDVLGKPVGKQDPYMAAFGGLTVLDIGRDGAVAVRSVAIRPTARAELVTNTHLYFTGVRRSASAILSEQNAALAGPRRGGWRSRTWGGSVRRGSDSRRTEVSESLHRIKELGQRILAAVEAEDLEAWGRLLHEHWEQKRRLSSRVSLGVVDELYEHVRAEYGVLGGKIAGAGGGGFLLLYCPSDHERLESFMRSRGMERLEYDLAPGGVEVVAQPGGRRSMEPPVVQFR